MTVEPDNDTFNSGVAPNYASITEIADAPLVRENVKSRKVVILIFIFILICFVGFSVVLGEMLAIQRHSLVDVLITPYPYGQDAEYVATPCYRVADNRIGNYMHYLSVIAIIQSGNFFGLLNWQSDC